METHPPLARVATRLNRVAGQRAAYAILGTTFFAIALIAATAAWMPQRGFRVTVVLLGLAWILAVLASTRRLRASWARDVEAARWVEDRVPLEQRLLTWVSAGEAERGSRLWPVLEADNRAHLGRWSESRLGIPRVPGNVVLALVGLLAATLSVIPWLPATPPPPGGTAIGDGDGSAPGEGESGADVATGGAGRIQGAGGGGAGERNAQVEAGVGLIASVDEIQRQLGDRFERSPAGQLLGRPSGGRDVPKSDRPDEEAQGSRADPGRGDLGRSEAERGGRVPDAELAKRELDDGQGQTTRREGGEPGAGGGQPGAGQQGKPSKPDADPKARGAGQGKPMRGGSGEAEGEAIPSDTALAKATGVGTGAGTGKGGELLAPKPLSLDGGRHLARFSLTLGGTTGEGGTDSKEKSPTEPRGRIADATRGPQAADRTVRHEGVPAEYEGVVKRVFAREP